MKLNSFILMKDGKIAVNLHAFYSIKGGSAKYFTDWAAQKTHALGLSEGRTFVKFTSPGARKGTLNFLVSLDTAIEIIGFEFKTSPLRNLVPALNELRKGRRKRDTANFDLHEFIPIALGHMPNEYVESPEEVDTSLPVGVEAPSTLPQTLPFGPESSEDIESVNSDETQSGAPTNSGGLAQQPVKEGVQGETPEATHDAAETHTQGEVQPEPLPSAPNPDLSGAALLVHMAKLALQQAEYLVQIEQRIKGLESTTGQIVAIGQRSALAYLGLESNGEVPPEQTLRSKITELVNQYCAGSGESQDTVYGRIYGQLYYRYKVNIKGLSRRENETHLAVAERHGHLDKILAILRAKLHVNNGVETAN